MDNATPDSNSQLQPVVSLPLEAIRRNPAQPRQRLDEAGLAELAASLREHGVLHPVLVRPLEGGTYELIAGERRWQAARRAGLATLPALVLHASPRRALELALVENVQRADLTPLEEADAYRGLMATLGLTQERLAERLGISRVAVTNRLRLLGLTPVARQALLDAHITEGHARALLALHGEQQDEAVRAVVAGGLSVRQTERLVRRMAARPRRARAVPSDPVVDALTERLRRALGAPVRARRHAGGLAVLIHFHAPEAAYQLVEALGGGEESDDV